MNFGQLPSTRVLGRDFRSPKSKERNGLIYALYRFQAAFSNCLISAKQRPSFSCRTALAVVLLATTSRPLQETTQL